MNIYQLRRILSSTPKYPGTKQQQRSLMCNHGYPGTFNLSLSNDEHLTEYGQILEYTHSSFFSKIGQMIRLNDWHEYNEASAWRYLSLFHMSDVSGVIMAFQGYHKRNHYNQYITKQFVTLCKKLGLDLDRFKITYLPGGNIKDISAQKYDFDYYALCDPITEYWVEAGFKEHNLVPEVSRNTFLTLNNFEYPSPWGYRNEIHYEYNGELLDIATLEHFCLRPIPNKNGKIFNLTPWDHYFGTTAFGVERLLMVLNNLKSLHELDHIKPLIIVLKNYFPHVPHLSLIKINEGLRLLGAILADVESYSSLSRNRKAKLRKVIREMMGMCVNENMILTETFLTEYYHLNAHLQLYYPELQHAIERTVRDLHEVFERTRQSIGV